MRHYAQDTSVPVERSKAEIEGLLTRYGADQFISGWKETEAFIIFRAHQRFIRFSVPLPSKDSKEFLKDRRGIIRPPARRLTAWEQECRRRWRALALVVKAKLEAVQSGITSFEEEFLAHILLPGGQTLGQWAKPQVEAAYATGQMAKALPGIGGTFMTTPEER